MPRKSPEKRPDALLAALIDKLPAGGSSWPAEERIAWLKMMAMAFNVVYAGEAIDIPKFIATGTAEPEFRSFKLPAPPTDASGLPPPTTSISYVIDAEGFAMCGAKPVKFSDVLPGTIFTDQRSADAGRSDLILWHDIGTRADGALPAGVRFQIGEAKPNGSAETVS